MGSPLTMVACTPLPHALNRPTLPGRSCTNSFFHGPMVSGSKIMDLAETQQQFPPVEHKVAVTHPGTGRKALYVNRNSTTHIKGLSERENEVLLPFLQDHIRAPEFQCRLHWQEGTVAFWDNRSVEHYAVADYVDRRVMHRCTVAGENAR